MSEREADSILGQMWHWKDTGRLAPYQFSSMKDLAADTSIRRGRSLTKRRDHNLALASLGLFRGQTECPSNRQEQLKQILAGTASELVARTFVNLRGRHSSWDRSDLEGVATVFNF